MLEPVTEALSASPWTYALVLAIVAGDAVLPVFPGETAVLTAAVIAGDGELSIVLVVAAAIAGAMLGDTTSWLLGRTFGERAVGRLAHGGKARDRVAWSRRQLRLRGAWLVVVARFIPGGRTATTLAAGTLGMPLRRFVAADAVGAVLWSLYAAGLGWFGGEAFGQSLWKPLAVALGIGAAVGAIGELLRRRLDRRAAGAAGGR